MRLHTERVKAQTWSWGESNPRPLSGDRPRYDHSRDCGSTATALPGQLSLRSPPDLSPVPTVFPVVSGLSCRHPLLLLPGCSGQAPRALTGRDNARYRPRSGGESELLIVGSCVGAPFKESEQLRSHDSTSGLDVETDQPLVK